MNGFSDDRSYPHSFITLAPRHCIPGDILTFSILKCWVVGSPERSFFGVTERQTVVSGVGYALRMRRRCCMCTYPLG